MINDLGTTVATGGKGPRSTGPGAIVQSDQALLEEPLAPRGDFAVCDQVVGAGSGRAGAACPRLYRPTPRGDPGEDRAAGRGRPGEQRRFRGGARPDPPRGARSV